MINTLSKLSKINANQSSNNSLRFNGSLPINITVLKTLGFDRYKLLLGTKEFTTKSQKKLEKGTKYWGSFGEGKNGIVTISNLVKKPNFLQKEDSSIDIECIEFLSQLILVESPISTFKEWIIENLSNENTDKETFKLLSQMFLALKEDVLHLPLKHNGIHNILQIKIKKNTIEFYCAFENLGPIKGSFIGNKLKIDILFNKSYFFLVKEMKKSTIISEININKEIEPFYNFDKLILDLKG